MNEKNLKRYGIEKPPLSHEEAKRRGKKGGKASVDSRRRSKMMKDVLSFLLDKEITNKSTGEKGTTMEAICVSAIREAMEGNIKAMFFIRDTIGQAPEETTVVKGDGISITVADKKHKEMLENL